MRRREFIGVIGGAAAGWPLAALAQQAGRPYRLGVLSLTPRAKSMYAATIDELQALGFIEGRDVIVDERGFGIRPDELSSLTAQLAQSKVDVILAGGALAIYAAQAATHTIPIIGVTDDMVLEGHVSSMANHGGNTTGISILARELDGKRQQILMEVLPPLTTWRCSPTAWQWPIICRRFRLRRALVVSNCLFIVSIARMRLDRRSTRPKRREPRPSTSSPAHS
ncbi:ABC transporter substrate binding protein [Bradyrhizobium macuxiense]|uniref:ABC transporter substrate binding protein n=1 Tax=Bradyrhizobium macuxiense TaxID=1755647 RepID=UPI0009EC936F